MKVLSNVMTPGGLERKFYLDLMFCRGNSSLGTAKEEEMSVRGEMQGAKENVLETVEIEKQTLLYTERPGVYSRDPRQRDLSYASILKMEACFWKKETT